MAKKRGTKASGIIENPLMSDLTPMDGVRPVGVITKVKGSTQTIAREIHYGERGISLVEWEADDIAAKRTKDGMKRQQTLTTSAVHDHDGKCPGCGLDLIAAKRQEYRDANPQLSIDDVDQAAELGRAMRTDENGVVLTDTELAEKLEADRAAVAELQASRNGETPPWPEYDSLGVGAVRNRLEHENDRMQVLVVGAYEDANKKRSGVLDAVTRRSAQLLAEGK